MPNAITQCFLPGFEPRPLDPEIDEHTHNEATALPREIRGLFDIADGKQLNTGLVRQVRLIRVYISFFLSIVLLTLYCTGNAVYQPGHR